MGHLLSFRLTVNSIEDKRFWESNPDNIIFPLSIASGLSVYILKLIAGICKIAASSLIVPESLITQYEFN